MYKIYSLNENFFEKSNLLNSWVAGWIAADGSIYRGNNKYRLELGITESDIKILEIIKNLLNWTGPIEIQPVRNTSFPNTKPLCRFQINCKKLILDLENNFNICQNKTIDLLPPNLEGLSALSYIAGLVEGDGSFGTVKKKSGDGYRIYPYIQFGATQKVLEWVKSYMSKYDDHHKRILSNISSSHETFKTYQIVGNRARYILRDLYALPIPKLERKWTPELLDIINSDKEFEKVLN